jgi:hypothetical protein
MWKVSALVGLLAISLPAAAAELTIVQGRLTHAGSYTEQPIAVTNNGTIDLEAVELECGFFRNGVLLATNVAVAQHVLPHQTAYVSALASHTEGTDKVECRAVP